MADLATLLQRKAEQTAAEKNLKPCLTLEWSALAEIGRLRQENAALREYIAGNRIEDEDGSVLPSLVIYLAGMASAGLIFWALWVFS